MGAGRDQGDKAQEQTTDDGSAAAANQQAMFGDMMQAQANNRQKQLAMRQQRLSYFTQNPAGFMGQMFQQKQPDFQGLLAMLGQNPAMQAQLRQSLGIKGQPMTMNERLEAQRNGYFDAESGYGGGTG